MAEPIISVSGLRGIVGETLTPIKIELADGSIMVDGEIVHITLISDLLLNLPTQSNQYLCGIKCRFKDKAHEESIKHFIKSQEKEA